MHERWLKLLVRTGWRSPQRACWQAGLGPWHTGMESLWPCFFTRGAVEIIQGPLWSSLWACHTGSGCPKGEESSPCSPQRLVAVEEASLAPSILAVASCICLLPLLGRVSPGRRDTYSATAQMAPKLVANRWGLCLRTWGAKRNRDHLLKTKQNKTIVFNVFTLLMQKFSASSQIRKGLQITVTVWKVTSTYGNIDCLMCWLMFNLILMEAGIHSTKWSYLTN